MPEGRLSKLSSRSSRASSRSSIGSDSTRASRNLFGNNANNNSDEKTNGDIKNGSKNVLLDALIKKFNVSFSLILCKII